jgi:hypothetical protein
MHVSIEKLKVFITSLLFNKFTNVFNQALDTNTPIIQVIEILALQSISQCRMHILHVVHERIWERGCLYWLTMDACMSYNFGQASSLTTEQIKIQCLLHPWYTRNIQLTTYTDL